ncbi:YIP1 family protein [Chryseobacterium sp. MEBOG07]|uniref:YIP1 family protein n=1 Tax=Chryseobacterium sp. MEBOG07 TaxID=2879939 RepID=UPI001F01887D|nr:YIP1 family protein [Chryseobacterium sp. MEBOG07]UKB78361.1 YIP1 family protein [Chryseobacterium sp. MEBOG07]
MNWKTIFNPFEKFDEKLLLLVGIFTIVVSIAIGYWTETTYTSIYKIDNVKDISLQTTAIITTASFASAIIILFILGKTLNNRTRLIDIVNTVLLSQLVLAVLQPINKIPFIENSQKTMISYSKNPTESTPILDISIMMAVAMFSILVLIYSIVIYYNGFKTATNIKKWQHIVLFAVVSLVTTLACQIIMSNFI